jgi:hypothetical protein
MNKAPTTVLHDWIKQIVQHCCEGSIHTEKGVT